MRRGQITVFFSLLLPLILALTGTALESARHHVMRSCLERSLVLCEYSVLSEYQKDLWEKYGVFFVDTGYGTGVESKEKIKGRILEYLTENLSPGSENGVAGLALFSASVSDLQVSNFSRMTDENGKEFYEQAVAYEKYMCGAEFLDDWMKSGEYIQELEAWQVEYAETEAEERQNLEVQRARRLEMENVETQDPTEDVKLVGDSLLTMVVPALEKVSLKSASLERIPSKRELFYGSGSAGRYEGNIVNDQWFHTYLLDHFTNAKDVLTGQKPQGEWLAYEMEYILAGEDNDRENLKEVVNRLLMLREGANYVYLMTDEGKKQEAYGLAAIIAGITLMPEIVDVLHQLILLAWAYGESVLDVRSLLLGNRVDLVKGSESWKLPLGQLFFLKANISKYDMQDDESGLDYEAYLRMLATLLARDAKCMRGLDVIEGTLRTTEMGRGLYVDQCADGLWMKVTVQYPALFSFGTFNGGSKDYVLTAERRFSYEW